MAQESENRSSPAPDAQVSFVDMRMDGVGFSRFAPDGPFAVSGLTGAVSLCYLVRRGEAWLEVGGPRPVVAHLPQGSIVGLSGLIPHWLRSQPGGGPRDAIPLRPEPLAAGPAPVAREILVGHAPIKTLAESSLISGVSVIPAEAGAVSRRIWRAMEAAEEELTDPEPAPGRDAVVRRCAEIMLINIVRWLTARAERGEMDGLGALGDPRIMRALAAAEAEPMEIWTLTKMARTAGMSRSAFAQRFHQLTGSTPVQSLIQSRLHQAAAELAHTRRSIESVGARAGYGSSAAFIRAFRRAYHLSPGRWRAERGWTIDQFSRTGG